MYKNILLPIDIEDAQTWKGSFNTALNLMKCAPDATLHIMAVVPNYGMEVIEEYFPKGWVKEISKKYSDKLNEIVDQFLPKDMKTNIIIKRGIVYQTILNEVENIEADLIVIYAHNPDRSDYLLGPNVARVVRHADISVLVVR